MDAKPSPSLPSGLFLVFEGLDGSGKTTQCRMLKDALAAATTYALVLTKEPTDGPWGQQIRERAYTGRTLPPEEELQLFINDRKEHIETLLAPSLRDGAIIIQDRYYFSTAAYQGSRGLDPQSILAQHRSFAPTPDRVYLIDIPPEVGIQRIEEGRGEQRNAFEQLEGLQRTKAIFDTMKMPFLRRLDGLQDPHTLHTQILHDVNTLLPSS